jgi:hypothetical protein
LRGNTGFRRYLKTISDQHFAIDAYKVEEEKSSKASSCCDTVLNPLETMLC